MMVPYTLNDPPFITAVTLAVFEDSGWYQPDYTKADGLIQGRDWGFKQGCSFAKEKCLTSGVSTGSPPHFFANASWRRCTLNRKAMGCSRIREYDTKLPAQYRYFSSPYLGGPSDAYDYCPTAESFADGPCNVIAYAPALAANGEGYGPDSLCIDSTLLWSDYW
jgi:hypothetical protein